MQTVHKITKQSGHALSKPDANGKSRSMTCQNLLKQANNSLSSKEGIRLRDRGKFLLFHCVTSPTPTNALLKLVELRQNNIKLFPLIPLDKASNKQQHETVYVNGGILLKKKILQGPKMC